ncbi:MAG: hypothetical protein KF813_07430 [Trueperaceae bacterium]|nr:hypothetical protein [Trueperaceae bacterium]
MSFRAGVSIALILTLLVVPGCGGVGPIGPDDLREVSVEVTLPAAFSGVTITTPYGSGPVADGAGKASVTGHGPALASVESSGKTLLLGWVSEEMTKLNTRTTAEVFAFYYLNGQFLEPAMQLSLLDFVSVQRELNPVAAAVSSAITADPPNLTIENPAIATALEVMAAAFSPTLTSELGLQNLTISPDNQTSGIIVKETAPLVDAINVYNGFRRPVHVFVDRTSPDLAAIINFPLDGAAIEEPATARTFQHFTGFAQGSVPRSAIKSQDVAVPGAPDDETAIYIVTVVGAGGDLLSSALPTAVVNAAKEVAMRTAIERFLLPTITSALEFGAAQRTAADPWVITAGLSDETIRQIEQGDFEQGINNAFADLFNERAATDTLLRVLEVYYPNVRFISENVGDMISRLSRNLEVLVGSTATSVSSGGSGIISTIKNSKRVETFRVVSRPVTIRLNPAESTIGTGGQVALTANVRFPEGGSTEGVIYRYSVTGANAGYATVGGVDMAFPFETTSTSLIYKHRDTINIAYGTDTITIEAVQNQDGIPTVVASGTATVTVRESTITLSPATVTLDFGQQHTFIATVDPLPESGTLSYVFVTFGKSTFAGGSQTSVGASNSVVFVEADTEEGAVQPVTVTVILDNEGSQTVLGQAEASATFGVTNEYVLSGDPSGTGNIYVDDALDIKLNGVMIYTDGMARAGSRSPISITANKGDVLTFEVRDHVGVCSNMSTIYIVKGDRSAVADPGFDLGCGRPVRDMGVSHTHTYTVKF